MADSGKRKASRDADGGASKKKKKGNNGKWRAPKKEGSGKPKANTIEPGDVGIWVTCPLHVKGKAAREMEFLFDDYAEKIYGIKTDKADASDDDDDDEEDQDIEAAIQKEVGDLQDKKKNPGSDGDGGSDVFTEVRISQECLLFMKCKPPVEPVEFSRQICLDAAAQGGRARTTRYLNRLTPVSVIVKASEMKLVEEGARRALAEHFKLKPKEGESEADEGEGKEKLPTYAIRPSIRNHNTLKRDDVIKSIAGMVGSQHKVNLGNPDKVILIDIYQGICGLSVVPGDWDSLKRYNLTELYKQRLSDSKASKDEASAGAEDDVAPAEEAKETAPVSEEVGGAE